MAINDDLKKAMRNLGHAIAASPKTADTVRRIRHQGYSLYLIVNRDEEESGARIELTSDQPRTKKPRFLLNKGDVSFLESVGIDATRPGRRRRTVPKHKPSA